MRRAAGLTLVTAAASAVAVLVGSVPAQAAALSPVDQRIHDKLAARSTARALGPDLAGLVTDATGTVLWSRTPSEQQLPASNTKLVTAVNALQSFGPTYRFTTRVLQGPSSRTAVLVGSGDPSLSGANLTSLARTTAAAMQAKGVRAVYVRVDDSLFPAPTLARGWKASYLLNDVSPVRALVVDGHRRSDTSLDAGKVFAGKLAAQGLRVISVGRRTAPAGAAVLARVQGRPLSSMIGWMLRESDNDYAEALHRLVALKGGYAATWTGAAAAQRAVLAAAGVNLGRATLYDGSGLSRSDRLTPNVLAAVLRLAFDGTHPALASLQHGSLAIAGRTGTLAPDYLRYTTRPTRCAAGLVEAKTGSLHGVITLSGFARGSDGQIKIFSFLLNGVDASLTTRRAVDRLAATVTGCY